MQKLIALIKTLSKDYGIKVYVGFTRFYVFIEKLSNAISNTQKIKDVWDGLIKYYFLDPESMYHSEGSTGTSDAKLCKIITKILAQVYIKDSQELQHCPEFFQTDPYICS